MVGPRAQERHESLGPRMQRALWPDGRVEADRHAGEEGGNGKKEGHQFPSCSEGRPPREPMGDSCEQGQLCRGAAPAACRAEHASAAGGVAEGA